MEEEEEHKPKKKKQKAKCVSHHSHAPPFHLEKFLSVFGKWHHHFETLPPKQVG
jgi:hypothetical protein